VKQNGLSANHAGLGGISLEKSRAIAFTYLAADDSVETARARLLSLASLNSDDRRAICRVHSEDKVLAAWRIAARVSHTERKLDGGATQE
jgi:hypothetical protein